MLTPPGITTVTNQSGASLTFHKSTDAGTMTIDNQVFATTTFNNASAGSATINNIARIRDRRRQIQEQEHGCHCDHQ